MKINPFANIYNKNGDLSSSLFGKMTDTFIVFWGTPSQLGLFDYVMFAIPPITASILPIFRGCIRIIPISVLFLAPYIALTGGMLIIETLSRILTSSILTVISMPIIILVHIISTELIRRNIKQGIDNKIKGYLDHGSNSVTIIIPPHRNEWIKTIADHIINKLNNNPTINRLEIIYSDLKKDLLGELVLKLKYVTRFSAPDADFKEQIPLYLPQIGTKNEKEICETQDLLNFLTKNTQLDELYVLDVSLHLDKLNNMFSEGIQYPCKLSTGNIASPIQQINSTMDEIRESYLALGPCFELCKIWCTDDNKKSLDVNRDILQYIMMMLINMCPKNIVEKNKNGFIKTINSNGFFYKPSPKLIESNEILSFHQSKKNQITELLKFNGLSLARE